MDPVAVVEVNLRKFVLDADGFGSVTTFVLVTIITVVVAISTRTDNVVVGTEETEVIERIS